MAVNLIKNIIPDFFIKKFGTGSATLARLAHINQLQEDLAVAVPYVFIGATVNQPIGQAPTISILSEDCSPGCYCKGGRINCFTIASLATGQYMITMSESAAKGFNVLIAPLPDARHNISVEVVSPTQVKITTYDIVGAAYINNAFKNTFLAFLIWN